jgi:hypothetical protein
LLHGSILLEDGRASETKELGVGEEVFDRLMVVAELGAVALVEDDGHTLIGQWGQHFLIGRLLALFAAEVALAGLVQGDTLMMKDVIAKVPDSYPSAVNGFECALTSGKIREHICKQFLADTAFCL